MNRKKIILSAAAACAAFVGLAATSASAQPWWGGGYRAPIYAPQPGRDVGALFRREDRLDQSIRRLGWDGRLNPYESRRAWSGLRELREDTAREAREHGGWLPPWEFQRIAGRLERLERFVGHEARDFD